MNDTILEAEAHPFQYSSMVFLNNSYHNIIKKEISKAKKRKQEMNESKERKEKKRRLITSP